MATKFYIILITIITITVTEGKAKYSWKKQSTGVRPIFLSQFTKLTINFLKPGTRVHIYKEVM